METLVTQPRSAVVIVTLVGLVSLQTLWSTHSVQSEVENNVISHNPVAETKPTVEKHDKDESVVRQFEAHSGHDHEGGWRRRYYGPKKAAKKVLFFDLEETEGRNGLYQGAQLHLPIPPKTGRLIKPEVSDIFHNPFDNHWFH